MQVPMQAIIGGVQAASLYPRPSLNPSLIVLLTRVVKGRRRFCVMRKGSCSSCDGGVKAD